ncbi:hypothetical protein SAMN05444008_10432 [Cnuella takakiae]|uniref:Nucleoid associated protein NdpA n=1 Tax=Cnuella takakiae TaxID=1302690 RepID=A0A1M4XTJ3_9BACT|nr:nucleoid-associated protein [Cnuella takakiae]OLY92936.1 hypothetical protein BUE76_14340 [Cnuella takakiae]SHE96666.1 hypothetical protein SAMN05444008_10432 [Cnuella takakiae]
MELELKSAALKQLMVHYVGSKNNLEPLHVSPHCLELDEESLQAIGESFLNRFKNSEEYYQFTHPSSLQFNEVYNFVADSFLNREKFEANGGAIARHLYESSTHPKVKAGELYVGFLEGLPVEGRMHKAIGLFKTENKSLFLDVAQSAGELAVEMKEGVELNKMDKGCLIINSNADEGFDVMMFDNQNRGEEALYWKEQFLNVTAQKTEYHHTNQFLTLTKQFITNQLEEEFGLEKNEQIELLNKSIEYFKQKESFDINEFQDEVFGDEERIESFRSFGSQYVTQNNVDIADSFDISPMAVKKQTRIYKSVLKLDKNFHIYIHGNTDLIEKGIDDDGRKFYKIYYQDEA